MNLAFKFENAKLLKTITTLLCMIYNVALFSQSKTTCVGIVKDVVSGEVLIGATVVEKNTNNGCYTDESGRFTITVNLPAVLQIMYLGYTNYTIEINNESHDVISINLQADGTNLKEVEVVASSISNVNVVSLSKKELTYIPSLGAKPDVIKAAQLLPGILPQNEGSSLLIVRGGDAGQNMYLIDNVPLIYVNHLGGFTSVFNPDVINSIDIYKGSFPAQYGGKLSSITNITQLSGDRSQLKGSWCLGLSDVSFMLEGPGKLKNSSFIFTARKTVMSDLFLYLASTIASENYTKVSYGFHDINGKYTWTPNTKNSLSLSMYHGNDYFNSWGKDDDKTFRWKNAWGNNMVATRWNSQFTSKLQMSNILSYSGYKLVDDLKFTDKSVPNSDKVNFRNYSAKKQLLLQSLWKYHISNAWTLRYGVQTSLDSYVPNYSFSSLDSTQVPYDVIHGGEAALYLENVFDIGRKLQFITGIRYQYGKIKNYEHLKPEPRLQLSYKLHDNHSLSLHYMKVYQTSHLIFTSASIMSNEVWIPMDNYCPPSSSYQYSAGWNGSFLENMFSFDMSVYYKEMSDLVTFKDGYQSIKNDILWQEKIASSGSGTSKGFELMLRKQKGSWTGFAGYTFSKTNRQYDDINLGKEYVFEFDRPHSFALSVIKELSQKWMFSASWVFQSGLPYTPVLGKTTMIDPYHNSFFDENSEDATQNSYTEALIYGERNSERMRNYHRLDVGFTYKTVNKYNNKAEWNFSVYNLYNRQNPYYYYYNYDSGAGFSRFSSDNSSLKLYQISFFPILPSISYKVYFNEVRLPKRNLKPDRPQGETFKERFKSWMYYE